MVLENDTESFYGFMKLLYSRIGAASARFHFWCSLTLLLDSTVEYVFRVRESWHGFTDFFF
jgi:hypothetical protein